MVNREFSDKTVFIFGGSSGLGLEISKAFKERGAKVVIISRSKEKLERATSILEKISGGELLSIEGDVSNYSSLEALTMEQWEQKNIPHIVINSAGVHLKKEAQDMSFDEWDRVIKTNLYGSFNVNHIFGRKMIQNDLKGCFINISSLGAYVALSKASAYCVSKSGVEMLTKSLASEWASLGIRVNAIRPGVFLTPLNKKVLEDKERLSNILGGTPMKRLGKINEISGVALFLASEEASFITGEIISVDGGFCAYSGY